MFELQRIVLAPPMRRGEAMISCWLIGIEQMDLLKGPVSVERQAARQCTNTLAHLRMKEVWL